MCAYKIEELIISYTTMILVSCSAPRAASGVVIEPYTSTTEETMIHYNCDQGLHPNKRITSICTRSAKWNPDPAVHTCIRGNI